MKCTLTGLLAGSCTSY